MIVPCFKHPNPGRVLVSDQRAAVRRHRDHARHRRLIALYSRTHVLCEACLLEGLPEPAEQVHHLVPVAHGGATEDGNLLAVCLACHERVGALPLIEQRALKARAVAAAGSA